MNQPQLPDGRDHSQVMRDDVMPAMDRISKCLLLHGFIFVPVIHSFYKTMEMLSRDGNSDSVDIPLIPVRGLRWVKPRVRFRGDSRLVFFPIGGLRWMRVRLQAEDQALLISLPFWHLPRREPKSLRLQLGSNAPKLPVIGLFLVGLCFVAAALIEAAAYAGVALFRTSFSTFAMAVRAIPFLLAILLVVFSSSDAWRVYGSEGYLRFTIITVILVILGIVAVYRIVADEADKVIEDNSGEDGWPEFRRRPGCEPIILDLVRADYSTKATLIDQKAAVLTRSNVTPLAMTDQLWTRLLMTNAQVLLRFTTILQVIAVALWVSGSFIALGVIVINSGAYGDLLPTKIRPSVIENFHIFGQTFIFSQQLVLLSVTLGAIAGLTFATVSLQDEGSRQRFSNHSLSDLRCSLATLSYYLGAIDELSSILRPAQDKIGARLGFGVTWFRRVSDSLLRRASAAINVPTEKTKERLLDLMSKVTREIATQQHVAEAHVRAALFRKAGDALRIIPGIAWHMDDSAELEIQIGIGEGSAGRAFQTGQPNVAIYHRAQSDSSIRDEQQRSLVDPALKWVISIPIFGPENEAIGVLNVDGLVTERTLQQLEVSVSSVIPWAQLAGYVLGLD